MTTKNTAAPKVVPLTVNPDYAAKLEAMAKLQKELDDMQAATNAEAAKFRNEQRAIIDDMPNRLGVKTLAEVSDLIRDRRKELGETFRAKITPEIRAKIAADLHANAKIPDDAVNKITDKQIADRYGCSEQTIHNIKDEEKLTKPRGTVKASA